MKLAIPVPENIAKLRHPKRLPSPMVVWLVALYKALKPLTLISDGEPLLSVWIRASHRSALVSYRRSYGRAEREDRNQGEADSPEEGWWVFTITNESSGHKTYFFSRDFEDGAAKAQKKFEEMFKELSHRASLPRFSPRRITRALAVLNKK